MDINFIFVEILDDVLFEKGCKLFMCFIEFLKGVVVMNGLLFVDWIEVCFVGWFNVGKLSLINVLINCKLLVCVLNILG